MPLVQPREERLVKRFVADVQKPLTIDASVCASAPVLTAASAAAWHRARGSYACQSLLSSEVVRHRDGAREVRCV